MGILARGCRAKVLCGGGARRRSVGHGGGAVRRWVVGGRVGGGIGGWGRRGRLETQPVQSAQLHTSSFAVRRPPKPPPTVPSRRSRLDLSVTTSPPAWSEGPGNIWAIYGCQLSKYGHIYWYGPHSLSMGAIYGIFLQILILMSYAVPSHFCFCSDVTVMQ